MLLTAREALSEAATQCLLPAAAIPEHIDTRMTHSKPLRVVLSLWEDFTAKRVMDAASQLTYSTLLAIVPVLAVIFAVARGFGYNRYIETWFRSALSGQGQVAESIIGFVNSYLVHTKSGIVFGFGLVFMLWTVVMLTRGIEQTFNDIWGVRRQRSLLRTFTDYLAMFFVLPLLIVVLSGATMWISSAARAVSATFVVGPLLKVCLDATPIVVLTAILSVLYTFVPNTRVRWRAALLPAVAAALSMQLLQWFYVHSQLWVSGYNAIYGSFAALPLFMLWVQFSWTIILVGAELSYANQNVEELSASMLSRPLSHRHRLMLSAMLASRVCRAFRDGRRAPTVEDLKRGTGLPMRLVSELCFQLIEGGIVTETAAGDKDAAPRLVPAEDVERLTVGLLLSRLESLNALALDISARDIMGAPQWRRTLRIRAAYLRAQRDVRLWELSE